MSIWKKKFGNDYLIRNPRSVSELDNLFRERYGTSKTMMLHNLFYDMVGVGSVLEVGCSIGLNLQILHNRFHWLRLCGIDINRKAINMGKKVDHIDMLYGDILDIPFRCNSFDMVFTSGVLIHIHPESLEMAVKELVRVAGKYVVGFEYYSQRRQMITYRGKENELWKDDWTKVFMNTCDNLKVVNRIFYPHLGDTSKKDVLYVLEKS